MPSCHFLLTTFSPPKLSKPHRLPPTSPLQPTLLRTLEYILVLVDYSSKTPFVSAYTQPPSRAKRSWFMYSSDPVAYEFRQMYSPSVGESNTRKRRHCDIYPRKEECTNAATATTTFNTVMRSNIYIVL